MTIWTILKIIICLSHVIDSFIRGFKQKSRETKQVYEFAIMSEC